MENKLSRAMEILCKLKSVLPNIAVLQIYYALFHPHLPYGLIAWGSAFPIYLKPLTILQNKAVKNIGGGNFRDNASLYYQKLKIIKLPDLYKYTCI